MPTARATPDSRTRRQLSSILIVDDSDGDALLAEMVLSELAPDAAIHHVDGGQQALDLLARQAFDLILLDLAMPGLTGFDVLTALGAMPDFDTEVIVLTSSTRPEDRVRATERGAGFVVKDSDFGAFRDHLVAALGFEA